MHSVPFFLEQDVTKFYTEEIIGALQYSRIKVESALDELRTTRILTYSAVSPQRGVHYHLTARGKDYLLRMGA